jgi:hypothetical protein
MNWSLSEVAGMLGDAAKAGYTIAKDATVKAVETVQDPEFQQKVKQGMVSVVETTKEVAAI